MTDMYQYVALGYAAWCMCIYIIAYVLYPLSPMLVFRTRKKFAFEWAAYLWWSIVLKALGSCLHDALSIAIKNMLQLILYPYFVLRSFKDNVALEIVKLQSKYFKEQLRDVENQSSRKVIESFKRKLDQIPKGRRFILGLFKRWATPDHDEQIHREILELHCEIDKLRKEHFEDQSKNRTH